LEDEENSALASIVVAYKISTYFLKKKRTEPIKINRRNKNERKPSKKEKKLPIGGRINWALITPETFLRAEFKFSDNNIKAFSGPMLLSASARL
jgi:hypothetical protein